MTRTPLRPLARVLNHRDAGIDPDLIEQENIQIRNKEMQTRAQKRSEGRLLVLGVMFVCAFAVIGFRMSVLASSDPVAPKVSSQGADIYAQRADILDRKGRILATNFETHSLYAQPQQMYDAKRAVEKLIAIFPDLDAERLLKDFTGERKFLWVKKRISPEQKQAVHNIGEPGLLFGPREMRLYPNGRLASHVLGGASFGREGVSAAEVIGVAGVEKQFDEQLRDPARSNEPLELSLDLTIQAVTEEVLDFGMRLLNAKGAAAVLMKVDTGELIALASLPDFDPNNRPRPPTEGNPADSPLFNRAVQGVYELGSTFKAFTIAQAMDLGLVNENTTIDTSGPLKWGKHKIRDFDFYGNTMPVSKVLIKSSNIGTARISQMIGAKRQQSFLRSLGFFETSTLEMPEAQQAQPLIPKNWSELSTMTISYGHGISASPLHLAAGYAALANGGRVVQPTLLRQATAKDGPQVMSADVARRTRDLLRKVVTEGTASMGEVPGYAVGGKTGTADKPKPNGGYYDDKVIATFASVFPSDKPEYVLIVTLDEPVETSGDEPRRTAGWTAVPVASELIRRIAPLLGLRPKIEPNALDGITYTSE